MPSDRETYIQYWNNGTVEFSAAYCSSLRNTSRRSSWQLPVQIGTYGSHEGNEGHEGHEGDESDEGHEVDEEGNEKGR